MVRENDALKDRIAKYQDIYKLNRISMDNGRGASKFLYSL